jgi:serine/threonine protein kinase
VVKGGSAPALISVGNHSSVCGIDAVQLLYILLDVARGMRYLHSCNIIHGDLKAGNVCLTTAPHTAAAPSASSSSGSSRRFVGKVTDFSLTKALAAGTSHCSSFTCGTLSHCAPEVLLHGHQSAAADVYAFGIMGGWRGLLSSDTHGG